jgi:hypothetical protein
LKENNNSQQISQYSDSDNYFDEKSSQVKPSKLSAFGISIESRYGKSDEIIEMIEFAMNATKIGINKEISSLFYDSKACICNISTAADIEKLSNKLNSKIEWVACRTLGQFEWNGYINHKDSDIHEISNKYPND